MKVQTRVRENMAVATEKSQKRANPLSPDLLRRMNAYWRAANYLSRSARSIFYDNPRLKRPLELSDVKPLIVGHWGTTPGQNCICIHLKPGDQEIRPGHVLCGRPWSRRAGTGG